MFLSDPTHKHYFPTKNHKKFHKNKFSANKNKNKDSPATSRSRANTNTLGAGLGLDASADSKHGGNQGLFSVLTGKGSATEGSEHPLNSQITQDIGVVDFKTEGIESANTSQHSQHSQHLNKTRQHTSDSVSLRSAHTGFKMGLVSRHDATESLKQSLDMDVPLGLILAVRYGPHISFSLPGLLESVLAHFILGLLGYVNRLF